MKTFFLLSDAVQTSLIVTIGGFVMLFITAFIPIFKKVLEKVLQPFLERLDQNHKQMNGLSADLVKSAQLLGEAIGELKGRKDVEQEKKDDAKRNQ